MWQDVRQAVRSLRKSPRFVALATFVLALGIGLNTAIFSIVYAMLFEPLPVDAPDRLISIYVATARQPHRPSTITSRAADYFREHSGIFEDVTMHVSASGHTMRVDAERGPVNAEWVLGNYFDVLGVHPALGRALTAEDDAPGNPDRAVVISHACWVRRFGSDPAVIGRSVDIAGWNAPDRPYTVVGVMPEGFHGVSEPWTPTQVWVTMEDGRPATRAGRSLFGGAGIGRLRPGISVVQAQAMARTQSRDAFNGYYQPSAEARAVLIPTNDVHVPNDPSAAAIPIRLAGAMTIVVAMVLLVAAANIAGILTARGVGRSGEIAVRRVLGAGPLRIVRQLLAESVLLSLAGGALGFALATVLVEVFRKLTPLQYAFDVRMNGPIALFTLATCVVAGIVVGVMPARQAVRVDVLPWLAGSGATQTRQTRRKARHAVTVPQVALSLLLPLVAGVYVRDLMKVELTDTGYRSDNLLVVSPVLRLKPAERATLPNGNTDEQYAERARRFYQQLYGRLRTMPGARDIAVTDSLPLREPAERPDWTVVPQETYVPGGHQAAPGVERASVSPGYFGAMGIRILSGRDFDDRDSRNSPPVAVISASAARQLWPGQDPIGRTVTVMNAWNTREKPVWYQIIGVSTDVKPILHERPARPFVYLALGQEWRPDVSRILARGEGDSRLLAPAVAAAINGADPLAEANRTHTLASMIGEILYPRRIAAAILALSGAIAMFLAAIGIYGVISYAVAQRTGEIGVRMALGAERRDIVRLVLREGQFVAAAGAAGGLVLGYAAIRLTSSRYLALPQIDPATLVLTPLVIGGVVLLACYVPARRAGRVQPMDVLRRG